MTTESQKAAPTAKFEDISPELAKQWLGKNHKNRKLNIDQVERLKGIILRGEWVAGCTDAIGLDSEDGVINGQHRLTAVMEGDTTVTALVVRGVDPAVIKVIDMGRNRNFTQLLEMDGLYDRPAVIASAVEWVNRLILHMEVRVPPVAKPTVPQLLDLLDQHPSVANSVSFGWDAGKAVKVDKGMLTGLHYTFASADNLLADEFFTQLAIGGDAGTPVQVLRDKYIENDMQSKQGKKHKFSTVVQAALLIRAWEATRAGTMLTSSQLRFTASGVHPDTFPRVSDVEWLAQD